MSDTDEGISSRKWSLERADGENLNVMQGVVKIATLDTKEGCEVVRLLVTAQQLWDAANELIKAARAAGIVGGIGSESGPKFSRLENMVAKSVGKADWEDVLQS